MQTSSGTLEFEQTLGWKKGLVNHHPLRPFPPPVCFLLEDTEINIILTCLDLQMVISKRRINYNEGQKC